MQIFILNKSFREDESVINSLKEELKGAIPSLEIKDLETKSVGYSVTWWEVVYIILGVAGSTLATEITKDLYKVAKEWDKRRVKEMGENARPQYISIFSEDHEALAAVLINPDGTEEDKTDYAKDQQVYLP